MKNPEKVKDEHSLQELTNPSPPNKKSERIISCSFCGINHKEAKVIIAGPMVNICDECTDLCTEIVQMHRNDFSPMKMLRES